MANFINYVTIMKEKGVVYMSKIIKLGERKDNHSEKENSDVVYCSFCHRPNTEVLKMVKGPGVNICSECAMIAVQYLILNDRMPSAEAQQILDAFWGKAK